MVRSLVNPRRSGVRVAAVTGFVTVVPPVISSVNYSQGQVEGGGESIVITGTGFGGVSSVTFLGTSATFVVDSSTQITATLPAHAAGTGNIQVTNVAGSSTIAFEYWSPSILAPTGWWRGSYSGSPFADISGNGRNFTEATNPPTVGAGVGAGGYTPADCDGVNDMMVSDTSSAFFNDNSMSGAALFYARSAGPSSPSNRYLERGVTTSSNYADVGLSHSVDGVCIWRLNSVFTYNEVILACPTGGWHLAQWKYNGATLSLRVDGGDDSSVACTAAALGSPPFRMGRNHDLGAFFDGKIMELLFSDTVFGSSDQTKMLKYCRQRYGLALT